jgi:hypothetical protein
MIGKGGGGRVMVRIKILALVVMTVASLLPALVQAGGLSLYKIGTADVGLASAGWAARTPAAGTTTTCGGGYHQKSDISTVGGRGNF